MRRKLLTYGLLVVIVGAVVWACQRDRFGHGDPNAVEPTLTVGEARDFFEYQFSEMAPRMTKATGDRPVGMMPGDFTPLWDKARIGANPEMDGADVPIDPKFIFVAVFNQITPAGDTLRQTVDVTQKLVVKKWRNTDEYEAFCYIASIVPTPEYHARHKNVGREFRYAGSKGDFSGFVIYRTLTGRLVGVDNYENGRRTRHDYFPQVTDRNEDSVNMVARMATGNISVQAGTSLAFDQGIEDDDYFCALFADPVTCATEAKRCPKCGQKYCICEDTWWPENWGDHSGSGGDQGGGNPDYNDGGNTGGGGGGTSIPTDPTEPWTGSTHDNIIDHALKNIPSATRDKIKAGSRQADVSMYQKPEYNYMHALRQPGQSVESAKSQMRNYFCSQIRSFVIYNDFHALGMALHPIMDAYSPPHQRIAEFNAYNPLDWLGHIGETDSNYPWDARQAESAVDFIYEHVKDYPSDGASDREIGLVFDDWVSRYQMEMK